ncbi:MAG TPA: helix-turn-helix transcriptional regulator [Paraburkholderia sp.]|uniref:helix-turn-helix transcriptional regulator n=1 Tax=Paraburkholderia sp. TaxID=1926495 RepID=UPI002DEB72C1|nr:helix-turn-helix transcriptional regulator [Paraburkholderia sp.]
MDYPLKTVSQLRPMLLGFRKKAGLTQKELAQRLGISQQSYAAFEANPAAASVDRLFRVLRLLAVDLHLAAGATQAEPVRRVAVVRKSAATPPAARKVAVKKAVAKKAVVKNAALKQPKAKTAVTRRTATAALSTRTAAKKTEKKTAKKATKPAAARKAAAGSPAREDW